MILFDLQDTLNCSKYKYNQISLNNFSQKLLRAFPIVLGYLISNEPLKWFIYCILLQNADIKKDFPSFLFAFLSGWFLQLFLLIYICTSFPWTDQSLSFSVWFWKSFFFKCISEFFKISFKIMHLVKSGKIFLKTMYKIKLISFFICENLFFCK